MSHAVYTTEGNLLTDRISGKMLDEAEAEARCKQANADAEELGIETRYEVREK